MCLLRSRTLAMLGFIVASFACGDEPRNDLKGKVDHSPTRIRKSRQPQWQHL